MVKRALFTGVIVAFASLAAGCDDGTSVQAVGDLQVTYRVGSGSSNCEEAGISFLRVYIAISETEDLLDQTFACQPGAQVVTFNAVDVGTYTIRAEGLDSGNNVIYGGQATTPVTVVEDQTNGPVSVILDQIRPAMEIFFGFSDVGGCTRFGVVGIVVRVYENGASLVHDQTYDCAVQLNESLLIPNLSETSTFDLRVRGTNEFGEGTYQFNRDAIAVLPGTPTPISAELLPCAGFCTAP
jgi:hypothetical protein